MKCCFVVAYYCVLLVSSILWYCVLFLNNHFSDNVRFMLLYYLLQKSDVEIEQLKKAGRVRANELQVHVITTLPVLYQVVALLLFVCKLGRCLWLVSSMHLNHSTWTRKLSQLLFPGSSKFCHKGESASGELCCLDTRNVSIHADKNSWEATNQNRSMSVYKAAS